MTRRAVGAFALIFAACLAALAIVPTPAGPEASTAIGRDRVTEAAFVGPSPSVDLEEAYAVQVEVDAYLAAVAEHERRVAEYLAAVAAEEQRQREAAARARPAPRPAAVSIDRPVVSNGDVWWRLALCECGGNPACNTGNGFYGTFQFLLSTWRSVGGSGYPHEHSYEEQLHRAQILQARSGWGQWPACARSLGLL